MTSMIGTLLATAFVSAVTIAAIAEIGQTVETMLWTVAAALGAK